MLTQRQNDLLVYLQSGNGICPSYEEIKEHLGLKSKAGVARLVDALVERGFIERLRYRRRALRVLATPRPIEIIDPTATVSHLKSFPTAALAKELRARGYVVARPM